MYFCRSFALKMFSPVTKVYLAPSLARKIRNEETARGPQVWRPTRPKCRTDFDAFSICRRFFVTSFRSSSLLSAKCRSIKLSMSVFSSTNWVTKRKLSCKALSTFLSTISFSVWWSPFSTSDFSRFLDFHFLPRVGGSWPEARHRARRNSPSQRF